MAHIEKPPEHQGGAKKQADPGGGGAPLPARLAKERGQGPHNQADEKPGGYSTGEAEGC